MRRRPRVAVLGSITADVVFRMSRFPVPGETLFATSGGLFPGGKGLNQAIAAARLGARATLLGRVGADALGDFLVRTARADGVDARYVARDSKRPTGIAAPVVLPDGSNSILAAPAANLFVDPRDVELARPAIEAADCLLIQFEAPMDANLAAARIAHGAGRTVILNPAPVIEFPEELLQLATVVVINEVEAAMLAPRLADDLARARGVLARGPGAVVVTLGPGGGLFVSREGTEGRFAAHSVDAIDTVGAGDAFCGALAVAHAERQPLERAVAFANAGAAISVTRAGAASSLARRDELELLLNGT